MRVILTSKPSGRGFSLEAGVADGRNHFDHHGEHKGQPAPCSDDRIPVIGVNDVVEITHIDADTFVGLIRMAGRELPRINFHVMEMVDLNGSSSCSDKWNGTLLYSVGIGQLARDLKFPRVSAEGPIDVTEIILAMMAKTDEEIIKIGGHATDKSEAAYNDCLETQHGKVGYWVVGANDHLDPSRPYEDNIPIVVVHRTHYKTISIYCDPDSVYEFGGKTVAGIAFAGHPKAAGSPRGVEYTAEDGKRVFREIKEL